MLDLADKFAIIKLWLLERFNERTSADGLVIIALGIALIIFAPLIKMIAYLGIVYGIYTLFTAEE